MRDVLNMTSSGANRGAIGLALMATVVQLLSLAELLGAHFSSLA